MKVLNVRVHGLPLVVPMTVETIDVLKKRHPMGQWYRFSMERAKGGGTSSRYDFWMLDIEMSIEVDLEEDGVAKTIVCSMKPGWYTDFGTVPLAFRSFINHVDPSKLVPFLFHDVLCNTNYKNRKYVDEILYELLRYKDHSLFERLQVWLPIRVSRLFKPDPNKDPWIRYEKGWSSVNEKNPQA
jgi:hypothetical protein